MSHLPAEGFARRCGPDDGRFSGVEDPAHGGVYSREMAEEETPRGAPSAGEEPPALKAVSPAVEGFLMSPQQERLWLQQEAAPEAFLARLAVKISGPLEVADLLRALDEVVESQEALRTLFLPSTGQGRSAQVIAGPRPVVGLVDLAGLASRQRRRVAEEWILAEGHRPFALAKGPCLRVLLLRLAEGELLAVLQMPSLCADLHSLNQLFDQITAAYASRRPLAPHERPMPYTQFAAWQRQLLELPEAEEERLVWRALDLAGTSPRALPLLPEIPPQKFFQGRFRPGKVSRMLQGEDVERLRRGAAELDGSLEALLLAVWGLVLWRSGAAGSRLTLLKASDGRGGYEELRATLGLFEKYLPVAVGLRQYRGIDDLVRRVTARMEEAEEEQEYFDGRFLNHERVEYPAHGLPLGFSYHHSEEPRRIGEVSFSIAGLYACTERFAARLACQAREGSLRLELVFDTGLYSHGAAELLLGRMVTAAASAVAAPQRPLAALEVLSLEERRQLLFDLNRPRLPAPSTRARAPGAVHRLIERACEAYGERVAVAAAGDTLTYGELNAAANRLARSLVRRGAGPEVPVAVALPRSSDLVVAVLAILKSGAVYLPLDPKHPPARTARMVTDAGAALVLTETSSRALLESLGETAAAVLSLEGMTEELAAEDGSDLPREPSPQGLAYAIFTSGSTGRPKAAGNTHGALANRLSWMQERYRLEPGDVVLHKTPTTFDVSVWELLWPLMVGARMEVARPGGHRDPAYLVELIRRREVTVLHFVPSMLKVFLDQEGVEECSSLRLVVASGEALPPAVGGLFRDRLKARLDNLYGPTEAAIDVTAYRTNGKERETVPIGRPITGIRTFVVDGELRALPWGSPGELCLAGTGLARGYLGQPRRTAESFVPDPFSGLPGTRLYRTGDRCRWRGDGRLEFLGRLDQQLKIRGWRVEPAEIEAALLESPAVAAAAVHGQAAEPSGTRLVAYVEGTRGQDPPAPAELRKLLSELLPAPMVPSYFVVLPSLPRLPSGKIDRKALPVFRPDRGAAPERPRTPAEEELAEIWRQVLAVPRVGPGDNFLALGGDSILAMQVAARAHRAGLQLVPGDLFQTTSLAELALSARPLEAAPAREPDAGPVPLTPAQGWFFDLDLPQPQQWNQSLLLRLRRELDVVLFEEALGLVARRHAAFRLRFRRTDSGWNQELHSEAVLGWVSLDLTGLRPDAAQIRAGEASERMQGRLALEEGPLAQVFHLRLPDGEALGLAAHHLIVDAVSWRVLLQDLEAAYRALESGARPEPRPAPTPFRWARAIQARALLEGAPVADEEALAPWVSRPWDLAGPLPYDLPGDGLSGDGLSGDGVEGASGMFQRSLDTVSTESLVHRAPQRLRNSPQEILLAALGSCLRRFSGREAVLVDLEGHGRGGPEDLSDAVGWFTSRTPIVLTGRFGDEVDEAARQEELAMVKREIAVEGEDPHAFAATRYFHPSPEVRRRMARIPRPAVVFNYLGRLDAVLGGSELFEPAAHSLPGERHPANPRPQDLEINAWVVRGRLEAQWTYAGDRFHRQTIEELADAFFEELRAFLSLPAVLRPGDFPLCELSSGELEGLALANGGAEWVEDVLPLSPAQEGMLLFLLVEEDGSVKARWQEGSSPASDPAPAPVFFNQLHCELHGTLQVPLLRQVWQEALARHPVLRTSFHWLGLTEPVQVVGPASELPWRELDWSPSGESAESRLGSLLEEDRRRGFRLEEGPLLRVTLVRLAPGRYRLLLSYHHLILDGWSVALLLREVFAAYEMRAAGQRPAVEPPPEAPKEAVSFERYLEWQRAQDRGPAEAFWRRRLDGWTSPPRLALDRGVGAETGRVRRHRGELGARPTAKLGERARGARITLSTLVQGAWALVLHEASHRPEVVFGTVVSGREGGFESTLGLLINALPTRVAVVPEHGAEAWLQDLQSAQVEARKFSYCALEEIHRWAPAAASERLFESLVVFENYPVEGSLLEGRAGLEVTELTVEERTNYPLALFAYPGERLRLELGADAGRFDPATSELLLHRLERFLGRLAEDRPWTLGELLAPDELERNQVINGWNPPLGPVPEMPSVEVAFAQQAARDPAAPALLIPSPDGGQLEAVSYGRLLRRVGRLAEELIAMGAGPEVVVALRMERSPELLTGVLAVLQAGAAFLPLDPSWPRARCREVLEEAGVHLLLTTRELAGEEAFTEIPIYFLEAEGELSAARPAQLLLASGARRRGTAPGPAADAAALAYVLYTSGSTGRPKGVQVSRGALAAHCRWAAEAFALSSRDRVLQLASLAFDASLEEIFPSLSRGAALVLRTDAMLSSAQAFWQACDRWGVTVADLPTVLFHGLEGDPEGPESLPRSLRLVVLGGERAMPEVARSWRRRYGTRVRLLNTYGPTEATVVTTAAEVPVSPPEGPPEGALEALPEIPLGRALPYARVYILDAQGRPRPAGVCGELALAGVGLARGYRGRPAETALRFVPEPWSGRRGSRMLLTGDLARWSLGGDLHFAGRRDRQLKIRGIRIEPGEIEAVLASHPQVREAYVQDPRGEDGGRLVAYYAPAEAALEELTAHLRHRLPESMVPAILLPLESLPRGASGKVDPERLPAPGGQSRPERGPVPPRNDTEAAVAEIFEEILGIEGVGALDNFFDLGGHSLLATRLVAAVKDLFEVDLPLRLVFEAPTVERLATAVATLILDELERMSDAELEALD